MSIAYRNDISVEAVNVIRKSMGWRQDNTEQLQSALDGSALVVAAYEGNNAIAMARLVWDGGGGANIPGILIMPEYRDTEVEKGLISQILDYLQEKLKPGFGIQVDIRAFGYQECLYENIGFLLSTKERRGVPMHICLTNEIELTDKEFKQMGYEE